MVNALATIVLRVIRHVLFILGLNIILVPVNMKEKKNILVIAKKKMEVLVMGWCTGQFDPFCSVFKQIKPSQLLIKWTTFGNCFQKLLNCFLHLFNLLESLICLNSGLAFPKCSKCLHSGVANPECTYVNCILKWGVGSKSGGTESNCHHIFALFVKLDRLMLMNQPVDPIIKNWKIERKNCKLKN